MSNDQSPEKEVYRAPAFADFKPELAAPGSTPERLAHLREHGFVIINDFVDNPWIPMLREAGRRVTQACAPENGYDIIDCSKGYVHRGGGNEPWAIRGILHPAFKEPAFAEFYGSPDFTGFVQSWCGAAHEDLVMTNILLWCNPRKNEHKLGWHRDTTWWGTGEGYFSQENRVEGPEAYSEEVERIRWKEIQEENEKRITEPKGVGMFLALADDECHELVVGSHSRWRTPLEHDVLLPKSMKDQGGPLYTELEWCRTHFRDRSRFGLRLAKHLSVTARQFIPDTPVPERERNTLSIGWSKWQGPSDEGAKSRRCAIRHGNSILPSVRHSHTNG